MFLLTSYIIHNKLFKTHAVLRRKNMTWHKRRAETYFTNTINKCVISHYNNIFHKIDVCVMKMQSAGLVKRGNETREREKNGGNKRITKKKKLCNKRRNFKDVYFKKYFQVMFRNTLA